MAPLTPPYGEKGKPAQLSFIPDWVLVW